MAQIRFQEFPIELILKDAIVPTPLAREAVYLSTCCKNVQCIPIDTRVNCFDGLSFRYSDTRINCDRDPNEIYSTVSF